MTHSTDIVGYTYQADIWCPGCTRNAFIDKLAINYGRTTENVLDAVAKLHEIDRHDERSYDSDDFPKVIFADGEAEMERCGQCGEYLVPPTNDTDRINYAIREADESGQLIGEGTARLIASQWHGGQWSALYAFASTGTILEDLIHEIEDDLESDNEGHLSALAEYVRAREEES